MLEILDMGMHVYLFVSLHELTLAQHLIVSTILAPEAGVLPCVNFTITSKCNANLFQTQYFQHAQAVMLVYPLTNGLLNEQLHTLH